MSDENQEPVSGATVSTKLSKVLPKSATWRAVLVIALLAITLLGLPAVFRERAQEISGQWLGADASPGDPEPRALVWSASLADAEGAGRLQEQYDEVRKRARFHLTVMRFFYVRHYMAIATSAVLGFLAALMLAFISRRGWANTAPWLVACFLVFAGASAFCAGYPALYQQKLNIEANKAKYLELTDLDNRIRTFAISNKTPDDLVTYLGRVDKEMQTLHALPIGLEDAALAAQRKAVAAAVAESDN